MAQLPVAPRHDRASTRRTLFTLLGVPWQTTRKTWLFLVMHLALGSVVAFFFFRDASLALRLGYSLLFMALSISGEAIHTIGHILSSRYVGAPMTAVRLREFFMTTYYADDPPNLPRRIHLGRALGGPIINIVLGLILLVAWNGVGGPGLLYFTVINLGLGFGAFLPIPGIDGEVIWRELRRR